MDMTGDENPGAEVWVLGETRYSGAVSDTVYELSAKARVLADALAAPSGTRCGVVVAMMLDEKNAPRADLGRIGQYGADRVTVVRGDGLPFDRAKCAKILALLAKKARPQILLASATAFGRSVMPYAAAILGTGLTADCTGLEIEEVSGLLLQTRPAIGGNIMAVIKTPNHRPQMATVRPRTFGIPEPVSGRTAKVIEPEIPYMADSVRASSFEPFEASRAGIAERDSIVSGGKGLRRAEGFELISRLAGAVGGGVGASRPAVEMKWIGYHHQVGLSGQVVSPKVYIAAGISGSVQHLAGMSSSAKVVSINRDPDAPIFGVSDVAICGDLYEVIPMLIERIERRKRGERDGG
ncbi:MAG: electron transfer flavoprotein subunit alpha/FixB family protein [Synergistaceae bacterium]|jgi:electron transfer flavoprotein alpha subunit|nr:electron transfer flavoprotein subunit alpha/FixB family protein [Synergistaceae bacterium]